jgi:hypothetical protein
MAIISKGLRRIGHKKVSRLMPSRSVDSIQRLIYSTKFKDFRANVIDASKSIPTFAFEHNISVEEVQTAPFESTVSTLHPPNLKNKESGDEQCGNSLFTPEHQMTGVECDEIDASECLESQSTVNPKVSTASYQKHSTSEISHFFHTFPLSSENFTSQQNCSTIELQCQVEVLQCHTTCDSNQNIQQGFTANASDLCSTPAPDLEFRCHSSSPPVIAVGNNDTSPYRSEELVHHFELKAAYPDLKLGGPNENSLLGSKANGNEQKTRAEASSQPRSIVSRKFIEQQRLASLNQCKVNLTPYRFATSSARAFLAKASIGLPSADIASTTEVRNTETILQTLIHKGPMT